MTLKNKPLIQRVTEVQLSLLSPELGFLLTCLRQALHQPEPGKPHIAAAAEVDWDKFLDLADQHRLAPVLYPVSAVLEKQGLPGAVREKLRQRFSRNMQWGLALSAELIRLSQALAEHGITLFPLKGPLLAQQLYGDISRRHAGDLDFLVEFRHIEKAWDILHNSGYQTEPPDIRLNPGQLAHLKVLRYHATFIHPRRNIPVELHWRLLNDRHEMHENDTRWFGRKVHYLTFHGHALPAMPVDRLLLYLCIHGSSHFWGGLFWLYDVAQLLKRHQDLDWPGLIQQAAELGCLRSLLLGTALAHILLAAPAPALLTEQWDRDPALLYLIRQSYPFADRTLSYPKDLVQTILLTRYTVRLRSSLARTVPYFLEKFFLPGYELPTVPMSLFPIYFLLKPFLWLKAQTKYAHKFHGT